MAMVLVPFSRFVFPTQERPFSPGEGAATIRRATERLARREGFEPPTLRFEERGKGKK